MRPPTSEVPATLPLTVTLLTTAELDRPAIRPARSAEAVTLPATVRFSIVTLLIQPKRPTSEVPFTLRLEML